MKFIAFASIVLAVALCAPAVAQTGYVPPRGFVPDAATATAIARAVLIPIYGADTIRREEPLTAIRQGDDWIVSGTLNCGTPKPQACLGGTASVRLSARDGRIFLVFHTK